LLAVQRVPSKAAKLDNSKQCKQANKEEPTSRYSCVGAQWRKPAQRQKESERDRKVQYYCIIYLFYVSTDEKTEKGRGNILKTEQGDSCEAGLLSFFRCVTYLNHPIQD